MHKQRKSAIFSELSTDEFQKLMGTKWDLDGIRVSQCVKSLKVCVFPPDSHSLCQVYLRIAKILKINVYLDVPKSLQSYSTSVCSENSRYYGFCLKIMPPKVQITWTFNKFHYQGPNFEI